MFQWIFENLKNITNTFKKIDFRSYKTKINNLKKKKKIQLKLKIIYFVKVGYLIVNIFFN
jgi:hypothetical protein